MPYYKAPDNSVHFLDDDAYVHLLPANSVEIQRPATPELTYAQKRVAEYPPMADYLDGIVKGDQTQVDTYVAACLAVKAKYPK